MRTQTHPIVNLRQRLVDENVNDVIVAAVATRRRMSPEVRRRHRIRLHNFDGSSSFESFWSQFQNCASYNRWNDADKLAHLEASLTGDAQQIFWDTDAAATDTIDKMLSLIHI